MGAERIDLIDLETLTVVSSLASSGITPRHIVLSSDDATLFSSNHLMDTVRMIDVKADTLIGTVRTGTQTRSLALADDEASVYVSQLSRRNDLEGEDRRHVDSADD